MKREEIQKKDKLKKLRAQLVVVKQRFTELKTKDEEGTITLKEWLEFIELMQEKDGLEYEIRSVKQSVTIPDSIRYALHELNDSVRAARIEQLRILNLIDSEAKSQHIASRGPKKRKK